MTEYDHLFQRVLETVSYDYTPANIRTINIHPTHGTTPIFDINNYSKEIEPEPPPHAFDQTLIYSILDSTASPQINLSTEPLPSINTVIIRVQIDGGANRSITSNKNILHFYKDITPFPIGSIDDAGSMMCTGVGIYYLHTTSAIIPIKMLYSESASETIVSPTDVVASDQNLNLDEWIQISNVKLGTGNLILNSSDPTNSCEIPLIMSNNLWYCEQPPSVSTTNIHTICRAVIRSLNQTATYELWHHRMGHAGKHAMEKLSQMVDGVPTLFPKNPLYKCPHCLTGKATKHMAGYSPSFPDITQPGLTFQMDFGFVRGSDYAHRDADNRLITSIDGYNSYLLIMDSATRHHWIFLTKSKDPPTDILHTFLKTHGISDGIRTIRTDQGGELAGSSEFRAMALKHEYIVEPTGADSSFQNGIAERPHRTLAQMMRCQLSAAGLPSSYWSFALLHSVYLINRLPHSCLPVTPIEAYTGKRPNCSNIRVFGCKLVTRQTGLRPAKLDDHVFVGTFLHYSATDRNVYYIDSSTCVINNSRHHTFDMPRYVTGYSTWASSPL